MLISRIFSAQNTIADFESFSLTPNSAYTSTNSAPFQTGNAIFEYEWLNAFGGFWVGGFSYTNKYDSATAGFTNLYGVKPLRGNTNSATYVVGQDGGTIKLKSPNARVNGFYITNTTYAYKSIRNGDSFARKFGDTTGTGSGTTIPQGSFPDYFKITAKGFLGGNMKTDSSVFYLADYRFANNALDYVVNTWQYFNLSNLGIVDSIKFNMYSSDTSGGFINTPTFFGMDDFSTSPSNSVGIIKSNTQSYTTVFPNPFSNRIKIFTKNFENFSYQVSNEIGQIILEGKNEANEFVELELGDLKQGFYFLQINIDGIIETKRIVKFANQ
jgi:hypothetical protein